MPRMICKQIYLRAGQNRRLKSLALKLGICEAELIRQSVDRAVLDATPLWPVLSAWEAELEFLDCRMAGRKLPARRPFGHEALGCTPTEVLLTRMDISGQAVAGGGR